MSKDFSGRYTYILDVASLFAVEGFHSNRRRKRLIGCTDFLSIVGITAPCRNLISYLCCFAGDDSALNSMQYNELAVLTK